MLAEDGGLARSGRCNELLAVIERHGDRALDFTWRHKGALAVATVLGTFLADPEAFRPVPRDRLPTRLRCAAPVRPAFPRGRGRLAPTQPKRPAPRPAPAPAGMGAGAGWGRPASSPSPSVAIDIRVTFPTIVTTGNACP
jgi:hypothetical protein